jgi:predicted dehydrogenase
MVSSRTRGFAVEDTAAVTLQFANGALGNLTISDAVQAPWAWEIAAGEEPDYPHQHQDTYLICGTKGSLAAPTLTHWRNEHGGGRGDPFITQQLFYVRADPWLEELHHFAQVVRGRAGPRTTVQDATRTLATTLAIARSAQTGQPVTVDAMCEPNS